MNRLEKNPTKRVANVHFTGGGVKVISQPESYTHYVSTIKGRENYLLFFWQNLPHPLCCIQA